MQILPFWTLRGQVVAGVGGSRRELRAIGGRSSRLWWSRWRWAGNYADRAAPAGRLPFRACSARSPSRRNQKLRDQSSRLCING
jgi:hypothetical protein